MGLADPHAQSILGCPSTDPAPERPTPPGTAHPNPAPHTCTETGTRGVLHNPHTEKGSHTEPAPAGSPTHTLLSTSTGYCTSLRKGMIHVNSPNRPWHTYLLDGNLETHDPRSGTPHITHPSRFLHTHLLGGRPYGPTGICTRIFNTPDRLLHTPPRTQPLPHASSDGLPHTLLTGSRARSAAPGGSCPRGPAGHSLLERFWTHTLGQAPGPGGLPQPRRRTPSGGGQSPAVLTGARCRGGCSGARRAGPSRGSPPWCRCRRRAAGRRRRGPGTARRTPAARRRPAAPPGPPPDPRGSGPPWQRAVGSGAAAAAHHRGAERSGAGLDAARLGCGAKAPSAHTRPPSLPPHPAAQAQPPRWLLPPALPAPTGPPAAARAPPRAPGTGGGGGAPGRARHGHSGHWSRRGSAPPRPCRKVGFGSGQRDGLAERPTSPGEAAAAAPRGETAGRLRVQHSRLSSGVPKAFSSPDVLKGALACLPPVIPKPHPIIGRVQVRRGDPAALGGHTTGWPLSAGMVPGPRVSLAPGSAPPVQRGLGWQLCFALCPTHKQQILKSWLWH